MLKVMASYGSPELVKPDLQTAFISQEAGGAAMVMGVAEYARRIEACRETLYRLAYCYVKNEQEALDIVGDAVYIGLKKLKKLRDHEALEPWMRQIVVHAALDHLKKKSKHCTYSDEALPELPAAEPPLDRDAQIDLYQALDRLPAQEKTYIILRFFEEMSFGEIAEVVGKTEAAVKVRTYRILKKLRQQLLE